MQGPFFEHVSVLVQEYERVVAENEKLRSKLIVSHEPEAGMKTVRSYQDPADSFETRGNGSAAFHVTDTDQQPFPNMLPGVDLGGDQQVSSSGSRRGDQQLLPSMLPVVDPGGEPDKIALPYAPRRLLRQQVHNTAPGDHLREFASDPTSPTSRDPMSPTSPTSRDPTSPKGHKYGGITGVGDIKEKIKSELLKEDSERPDVTQYYKTTGCSQRIARSHIFDNLTLCVIGVYAIWMAVDTDWNTADSILTTAWVFIIVEHIFCVYFSVELIIRFCAFRIKLNCFKDAWFVFDSVLVLMMVAETWVLNGIVVFSSTAGESSSVGNASILRLARLMRLTRLFRMARLVRMVPELVIMIKAIAAAARTVGFTLILQVIILYVFGIGFKQLLMGTAAGDELFSSVGYAMHSLLMHATFLDNLTDVMVLILADSYVAFAMMYVCVIMSAVTVMNMLIGVLCEVISAVAAAEKEVIQVKSVKETLQELLELGDSDLDGFIDDEEFLALLQNPKAVQALTDIDVDAVMLVDFVDVIFGDGVQTEKKKLLFADFMEALLQLRGSNTATVKDLVDMRKVLAAQMRQLLAPPVGSSKVSPLTFMKDVLPPIDEPTEHFLNSISDDCSLDDC